MIVSAVLYLTELLRYVLGMERRGRLKEDRDAGLGKRLSVCGVVIVDDLQRVVRYTPDVTEAAWPLSVRVRTSLYYCTTASPVYYIRTATLEDNVPQRVCVCACVRVYTCVCVYARARVCTHVRISVLATRAVLCASTHRLFCEWLKMGSDG